jgi:DNA topoisomerase VI subunit B
MIATGPPIKRGGASPDALPNPPQLKAHGNSNVAIAQARQSAPRVAFTTSRALEFFTESELTTQIGYPKKLWPLVLIKELIDNAIDSCETAVTEKPEIQIKLEKDAIVVSDNGPGLPRKIIKGVLDYTVRISDKKHYVAPTRGQLGNALKCVVAAPFVATSEKSVIEIVARGKRSRIEIELDRLAQKPRIICDVTDVPAGIGTILTIRWPQVAIAIFRTLPPDCSNTTSWRTLLRR